MISSLRSLQQVAPPPSVPVETGTPEDWARAEAELGLPLPPDYREFLQAYGSGCFQRFLWVLNPLSEDERLDLARQAPLLLGGLAEQQKREPAALPFPLHPDTGGLFPWGRTGRGDTLCWQAGGDPARWPVVVAYGAGGAAERFDRSTTTFLFQWLSGMIAPGLAPVSPAVEPARPFLSVHELGKG